MSSSLPQRPYGPEPQSPPHRSRVLIVDDNFFIRQILSEIFKREPDFEVCGEAANGNEALRVAQLLRPDLIVLDLAMPVMNGLDAARMLRRLMPGVTLIMYCVTKGVTSVTKGKHFWGKDGHKRTQRSQRRAGHRNRG